jgi:hypothetical protein
MELELGDDPLVHGPVDPERDWDDAIQRLEARIDKQVLEEALVTDINRDPVSIMQEVETKLNEAVAQRDGAYRERAQLLAWISTRYRSILTPAVDVDEPGWHILFIHTHHRQLSWHISPSDLDLFSHLDVVTSSHPLAQWNGHTTEQKYEVIRDLILRGI